MFELSRVRVTKGMGSNIIVKKIQGKSILV